MWFTDRSAAARKYHAFISYRVATDKLHAMMLCDCLGMLPLDETGALPAVFLDRNSLLVGERWDVAFARGMSNSPVVVLIISEGTIATMNDKLRLGLVDNVLVEWMLAQLVQWRQWRRLAGSALTGGWAGVRGVQMNRAGIVKRIVPLFSSADLYDQAQQLPATPAEATNAKCMEYLTELGVPFDEAEVRAMTPASVFATVCSFQALTFTPTAASGFTDWTVFMARARQLTHEIIKPEHDKQRAAAAGGSGGGDGNVNAVKRLLEGVVACLLD